MLRRSPSSLQDILVGAQEHRVQILVSPVRRDPSRHGAFRLERFGYRLGAEYFYPASSIKLCAAVAALQTLEELESTATGAGLLNSPFEIAPLFPGDPVQLEDASNLVGGRITVGHEIRKLGLVSDNRAFNRLFDLVGHGGIHQRMRSLGLSSAVVNHRLSEARSIPDARSSAAVTFRPLDHPTVGLPARTSSLELTNRAERLQVGDAYLRGDERVSLPMDFTARNGITLQDLQDLLIKVVRPDIDLATPGLSLRLAHRQFLVAALTQFPCESTNPAYPAGDFPTDSFKPLLPGVRRVLSETQAGRRVECTCKIGQAYGFTVENAYLRNPLNGEAVFVTAVIYTNADGVLNDDRYEYEQVAMPFMADLGEWIAREWLATGRVLP